MKFFNINTYLNYSHILYILSSISLFFIASIFNFNFVTILYLFFISLLVLIPNKISIFLLIFLLIFELLNLPELNNILFFKMYKISLPIGFELTVVMVVCLSSLLFNILSIYSKFEKSSYDLKKLMFSLSLIDKIFVLYLCFFPLVLYGGYLGITSGHVNATFGLRGYLLINLFFWVFNYTKYIILTNKDLLNLIEVISFLTLGLGIIGGYHGLHYVFFWPLSISLILINIYRKRYFLALLLFIIITYILSSKSLQLTTYLSIAALLLFVFLEYFFKQNNKFLYVVYLFFICLPFITITIVDFDKLFFKDYIIKTNWHQKYNVQNDEFKGFSGIIEKVKYKIFSDRLIIFKGAFEKIRENPILPPNGRSYKIYHPHWKVTNWQAGAHHTLLQSWFELGLITGTFHIILFFTFIFYLNLLVFLSKFGELKIFSISILCSIIFSNSLNQVFFWDYSGTLYIILSSLLLIRLYKNKYD